MDPKKRAEMEAESRFEVENRPAKTLVSLGGFAVTQAGKMVRSDFFRFLGHNLDDYEHITFTPEEARKIAMHMSKMTTGISSMTPMMCAGPRCPVASKCPLQQIGKAPLAKQCVIEVELIRDSIVKLFEEFDIDPNNFTEVTYVNELADLQIREMRINMFLSSPENATMLLDQVVGVDSEGDPIVQKQIHPYMEMKEQISNRRSKIVKLMVGDRQEKYKMEAALKVRLDSDPSSQMAAMRSKLENLKRELDSVSTSEQTEKVNIFSPEDLIDEGE